MDMKTNDTPQDAGNQNRRGFLKTGAASIAVGLSAGVLAPSASGWVTSTENSPAAARAIQEITRAAEAGVPLPVTQAQVGRMSVQMVEPHICQGAIHAAAEQIEKHSADLLSKLGLHPDVELNAMPAG
jgi:hypothetical protein